MAAFGNFCSKNQSCSFVSLCHSFASFLIIWNQIIQILQMYRIQGCIKCNHLVARVTEQFFKLIQLAMYPNSIEDKTVAWTTDDCSWTFNRGEKIAYLVTDSIIPWSCTKIIFISRCSWSHDQLYLKIWANNGFLLCKKSFWFQDCYGTVHFFALYTGLSDWAHISSLKCLQSL